MGRPYADELQQLRVTYEWAMSANIESLTKAVRGSVTRPMLAVGSGGSFTAADFACSLHQSYAKLLARPFTPMEFASTPVCLSDPSLMIVSAGGTNSDILATFRGAMLREPSRCIILSLRNDSPLSRLAGQYHFVDLVNFEQPWKKDGFLSTNSLLALVMLLSRSYAEALGMKNDLPPCIEELTGTANFLGTIADLQTQSAVLWRKQTILVIYSPNRPGVKVLGGSLGPHSTSRLSQFRAWTSQLVS
jgi:fructoselysine-6-P-deglycase FrlB-like protein